MTVLDVKASVASLRNQLLGARVANVYDLDAKTYLIKCAKAGDKTMVLLESGIRFHSTEFIRDKSNMPSGFSLKLRKHIRTKRVEEVRQVGDDRVVVFTFGVGDEAVHLVLELFAGGNIILLNHEHTILVLLRTHTDDATGARTAVREQYPLNQAPEPRRITAEALVASIERAAANPKTSLKDALSKELDYGPALVEHALLLAEVDAKRKAAEMELSADSADVQGLLKAFESVDGMIDGLSSSETQLVPGVIVRKGAGEDSPYDDFGPVVLKQHDGKSLVHFDSFDKAMDAYFTVAEDKKMEQQKAQQQKAALSKVDRVRKAHEASVAALEDEKEAQFHKAMLIEANLTDVDNAILVINSMLSQGTDWNALKKMMIKEESRKGNPVAQIIHSLKLDTNQITLQLTFGLDEMDEDSQTAPVTAVDVDLAINAYTNAQNYYQTKKKVAAKMEKTIQSQGKALKGAERKAKQDLKNVEVKSAIQQVRKQHWFEKFIYFISSENFLVLAGRDAQQNELLVKRHMDKGDIYLHADIHGAATHIIKNHTKDPVPPLTLAQAGLACVCRSAAWDAKMVTSAYWVHPEQVSKSAPTGEYLSTGSFMIRGKKNFLPPNSLVMGFGLLFKLDESCLAHHVGERKIRGMGDADTDAGSVMAHDEEADLDDVAEGSDGDELGDGEQGADDDATEAGGQAGAGGVAGEHGAAVAKGPGGDAKREKSGLSEASVASHVSQALSSGASTVLSNGHKEAGTSLRTTVDGNSIDMGTKDFDGVRGSISPHEPAFSTLPRCCIAALPVPCMPVPPFLEPQRPWGTAA